MPTNVMAQVIILINDMFRGLNRTKSWGNGLHLRKFTKIHISVNYPKIKYMQRINAATISLFGTVIGVGAINSVCCVSVGESECTQTPGNFVMHVCCIDSCSCESLNHRPEYKHTQYKIQDYKNVVMSGELFNKLFGDQELFTTVDANKKFYSWGVPYDTGLNVDQHFGTNEENYYNGLFYTDIDNIHNLIGPSAYRYFFVS